MRLRPPVRQPVGLAFGDKVERIRVCEALEEGILNAMFHGNLDISKEELAEARTELDDHVLDMLIKERCGNVDIHKRRIIVVANLTANEARFVIRDEGRGFNTTSVTGDTPSKHIGAGENRGMTLIRSLMDEVSFNKDGNEMVMCKRVQTSDVARSD